MFNGWGWAKINIKVIEIKRENGFTSLCLDATGLDLNQDHLY